MIKQIRALLKLNKEAKLTAVEADIILKSYVRQNHPNLMDEYNSWTRNKRNLTAMVITKFGSEALCDLEGKLFNEYMKDVSFFGGAIGRIADDLLDNGEVNPEEVYILNNEVYENGNQKLSLFYCLSEGIKFLLPVYFEKDFGNIIREFNKSQEDSLKLLNPFIHPEKIIDIKDRTGGYSVLLSYSAIFPEEEDLSLSLVGGYNLNGSSPITKADALYNFGAWLSRVDDLYDKHYDKKKGINQQKLKD